MTGEYNASTATEISALLEVEGWSDEERAAHFARQEAALVAIRAEAKSRLPELCEDDDGQEVLFAYRLLLGRLQKEPRHRDMTTFVLGSFIEDLRTAYPDILTSQVLLELHEPSSPTEGATA